MYSMPNVKKRKMAQKSLYFS